MRVVLAGTASVFALGFRALLETTPDLELTDQCGDLESVLEVVTAHKPEVVVADVSAATRLDPEAVLGLVQSATGTPVLLVSDWARERDVLVVLAAGAHGLALKTDSPDELLQAVRRAGSGHRYVPPTLRNVLGEPEELLDHRQRSGIDLLVRLSPQERVVLDLMIRGVDNSSIAKSLKISPKTVDTYRTRIHRKFGCTRTPELMRFLAENGLLPRPDSSQRNSQQAMFLLIASDDPVVRRQILDELAVEGARQVEIAIGQGAVAELYTDPTGSMLIVNVRGEQPAVAALCRDLLVDDARLEELPAAFPAAADSLTKLLASRSGASIRA